MVFLLELLDELLLLLFLLLVVLLIVILDKEHLCAEAGLQARQLLLQEINLIFLGAGRGAQLFHGGLVGVVGKLLLERGSLLVKLVGQRSHFAFQALYLIECVLVKAKGALKPKAGVLLVGLSEADLRAGGSVQEANLLTLKPRLALLQGSGLLVAGVKEKGLILDLWLFLSHGLLTLTV